MSAGLVLAAQALMLSPFLLTSQKNPGEGQGANEKVFFIDSRHYRNLNSFLRYADPEALSKPDPDSGFSSIIQKDKEVDRLQDPQLSWKNPEIKFNPANPKSPGLSKNATSLSEELVRIWRPLATPAQPGSLPFKGFPYPLCADGLGNIVKIAISADEAENISGENPPKYITVVEISFSDAKFPAARIISPSGSRDLDLFAARKLIQENKILRKMAETSPDGRLNLFFHWKKGLGTCLK